MVDDKPITELKETQQVARWQDRISVSKRWLEQVAQDNNWRTYIEELKGKYDVVLGNLPVPPIGEIFAYKDSMLANLYFKDPYITVNAKKDATIQSAYILEAGVNHLWGELKSKEDIELEITDTILIGHGWHKVGNNTKTQGEGAEMRMVEDNIYSSRVSWEDMFMNVGCKRPTRDNNWICQRIYRPTEDVKKDYPKVAKLIKGSPYPTINQNMLRSITFKEDFNYTAIYEVWDMRDRKIYTLADEVTTRYLEDPKDWPEWLNEFPYSFLSFHNIPDLPYPQSDIAAWEPQVREKIKVFTQMLNHIKRWNRQMVIKKGTMTPQELDKFEKGIDGAILQASGTGDIQTAIKMVDHGSLPPDIYLALDRIDAVIRKVNGLPEFMTGGLTKTTTRTEGELQMVQRGADARADRKQDRIERHCENIARLLIKQIKNNFDVPYIAKVTGKEPPEIIKAFQDQGIYDPASQTIRFSKEDIMGEFDVSVKAGSTLPLDKMTRDKILDSVMQVGAQIAAVPVLPPFLAEVIKERLQAYDIQGLEAAFNEQMKVQAANAASQANESAVETEKVKAETDKRQAQAQNVQVDTLIKGINAAGKASGVLGPEESLT